MDALKIQSFTSRLEECDERIARAERIVARQRGIIAYRLRMKLNVGLATDAVGGDAKSPRSSAEILRL